MSFRHFPTKQALFEAVLDAELTRVEQADGRPQTTFCRLGRLVLAACWPPLDRTDIVDRACRFVAPSDAEHAKAMWLGLIAVRMFDDASGDDFTASTWSRRKLHISSTERR